MTRRGDYALLTRLATGGMAEIYAARRRAGGEIVVIKQMLPQFATDPSFVEMFLDEGRTIALLRHPNIVRMLDFGYEADLPYLAMEYLHGVDLRGLIRASRQRQRALSPALALHVMDGVLAGLHCAHEARTLDGFPLELVHRDVSPQNVLVTYAGEVKMIDFGIAKARGKLHETRAGALKGKVPYMSPEQVRGQDIDLRTDVYAAGVVLFELLAGRRPYVIDREERGGEFAQMIAIVDRRLIALEVLRPDLPRALGAVIQRAMAAAPEDRYPTAEAMRHEIADVARTYGLVATTGDLAAHLATSFDDRARRLRNALHQQADEETLIDVLREGHAARTPAEDDDDSPDATGEEDAPTALSAAPASTMPAAPAALARALSEVTTVVLDGRLDERFDGAGLGASLSGSVILELSGIERISSFGIRAWLEMLRSIASRPTEVRVYLARCSEAVIAQVGAMRAFVGPAQLASVLVPFACTHCGHELRATLSCEDMPILLPQPLPPRTCPRCGGTAVFDDEPASLAPIVPHLGLPPPPHVRDALFVLDAETDAPRAGVDKRVHEDRTVVRVVEPGGRSVRWPRVLAGVEGVLELDLAELESPTMAPIGLLEQALRALPPEVTRILVVGAPARVCAALADIPRVELRSLVWLGACARCAVRRRVVVPPTPGPVSCRRCNGPLERATADHVRTEIATAPRRPIEPRRVGMRWLWLVVVVGLATGVAVAVAVAEPPHAGHVDQ